MILEKFLRTSFFTGHLRWLLLPVQDKVRGATKLYAKAIFVSARKIGENTTKIAVFQDKFTLCYIKLNIYI